MTEQTIFTAALEQEPSRRSAFLDEVCGNKPELRQRVEKLLQLNAGAGEFMERPAAEVVATIIQPPEQPGSQIGPYKLLEKIGEGGMGLVYMAEQQQPMRRLVALKIIKPGMDSREVIARFEAERQALAMMDHPHIAKVFEAGTTDTGRPFFVMELVRGFPINEFCNQKRLTVRERLELFMQVCQAVQHAHQKGIIHRDLKPTNVLVTLHDVLAVPKVIDFGIAKALGPQLTDHTLHTGFAQLVGTPLYMSPEQAELNAFGVDTRSDVYSLGVLLYELLTGTTPFDKDTLTKSGLDEMRRIIREDEPPRPSARVSTLKAQVLSTISTHRNSDPRRISATLNGELDWIVMRALEKDRSRRYESASAFAADVQRYLSDEPVLACPPTAMYKFQKFARKHRPALVTAAAIALSLILGTTVSAWQAVRATTAEAQANANEQKAVANEAQAKEAAAAEAQQRQRAEANEQSANTQRDEVKALNDRLQHTLYIAHVNMARHAWEAFAIDQMIDLLGQHRPKSGETDLRGFEWHYLHRLCHMEPLLTMKGHTHGVNGVAFSPDGKRVASGSSGLIRQERERIPVAPEVKIWDAATGQELLSLKGHTGHVKGVAFSPDGKRLASAGSVWDENTKATVAGEVKVWDAQTGQELISFKGHALTVNAVAFSPDSKRIASAGGESSTPPKPGELKIWNAETGQELLTLTEHTNAITNIAFSPDGTRLATSSWDYTARIWNADTGQQLLSIGGAFGGTISFSPDGKQFANGHRVYDTQTGKPLVDFVLFNAHGLLFSPDGKRLASTAHDQPVRIYDAASGRELFSYRSHTSEVREVAFSPDGKRLAFAHGDGTVKIWSATTSPEHRTISANGGVSGLAFSPDGKRVVSIGRQGIVKVSDVQTGRELLSIKGHTPSGFSPGVAYSPDGKRLASAGGGAVKIWDADTGKELLSLAANGFSVAFSPDGKRLACARRDLKVWDAQSGQELLSVDAGQIRQVWDVVFSPDGKHIACGGDRDANFGGVQILDAQSGAKVLYIEERAGRVWSVDYSPDGKRVASSTASGAVRIWDAASGQGLLSFKGHIGSVRDVTFSPDGKRLATQSEPLTLKVFDAQTGQETLSLKGGNALGLAFSPDGHRLANAAWNEVMIRDATPLPEKP